MEQLVGNLVWKENNCVASRSLPFPSIVLKNKKRRKKKKNGKRKNQRRKKKFVEQSLKSKEKKRMEKGKIK